MRPAVFISKFGRGFYTTVRKFDLFSRNIMLTYKGETSFSTFLGGFVSMLIFTIVWAYSGYLLQMMVKKQNSNNSKSTQVIDLTTNDQSYYPAGLFANIKYIVRVIASLLLTIILNLMQTVNLIRNFIL